MPFVQLLQDFHRSKFAVTDQKDAGTFRKQAVNISRQRQLLTCSAMSAPLFDPCPSNWDRSLAISQTDHQQLMPTSNPCAIHYQTDFSQATNLCFQPPSGDRFIPLPHPDGRIVQQSAQPSRGTCQPGFSRYLAGNLAHAHRTAQINSHDQPGKRSDLGDPLSGTQFQNSGFPGIIGSVGIGLLRFVKWSGKTDFTGDPVPINYSVVKVSGS
jgi:hypothetical protein